MRSQILRAPNCAFYIGHNSGPWDIANLFGKPIMMPNMTDFFLGYPFKSQDLGIFKKIYSNLMSRMLSRTEMFEVYLDTNHSPATRSDLTFIENNASEILQLLDEFLLLHSKRIDSIGSSHQCVGMIDLVTRRRLASQKIQRMNFLDPVEKDRILCRLGGCNGAIASSFLNSLN